VLELKNISYESRIFIITILAALLPLTLYSLISIYNSSKTVTEIIKKELQNKSTLVAYDIDKFIAGRITNTRILSQADVLEGEDINKIIQYLTEIVEADEWIEDIDIILPSGIIIASSGIQNEKGLSILESSAEIRELFLKAVDAKQGDVFVSNAHILDTGPGIQFITPITDDTNAIVTSILTIEVNLKHIAQIVSLFDKGIIGDKYVYIVDNDGKIIISDDPDTKLYDVFPDLSVNPKFLNAFSNQGDIGNIIYKDIHNDEVMAGYSDMSEFGVNKGLDWSIIAISPLEDITAPLKSLEWKLFTVALIIAFISLIIVYKFTSKATTILKDIAFNADQISQGDFSKKLSKEIHAKGEIGLLIISFDRMTLKINEVISQLKEKNLELEELYITDKLTGLFNRHKLDMAIGEEIKRAERFNYSFGVILLDIDNFKSTNDTYGHQIGDSVLKEFALILKENTRETDIVGRWGGEEFLIVCPESNKEDTIKVAEKLLSKIDKFNFKTINKKTASFGISIYKKGSSIEEIISCTDKALYKAKEAGRDRIEVIL